MSLRYKELPSITEADLQMLVQNKVPEGREIEYKTQLPRASEGDKREFLSDVCSFANCIGGDLLFGVTEDKGVATDVLGIEMADVDAEKLRLENLLRDGVQPRIIPGISTHVVPLANSRSVLIVRVPRSISQPHAVTLGGSFVFYSRNSAGKYRMDVGELRVAFLGSHQIIERIRSFRLERIGLITANESPIPLPDTGKIILHIVPFRAFEPGLHYDVSRVTGPTGADPELIRGSSEGIRHNFDGVLTFRTRSYPGYVQVFRNGILEAVDTVLPSGETDGQRFIPSIAYERDLIEALKRYLAFLERLRVDPPLALMLSLSRVKGHRMGVDRWLFLGREPTSIDRDLLVVPELVIQEYSIDPGRTLRPAFDAIWNAAGWPGSLNYGEQGEWRPYR